MRPMSRATRGYLMTGAGISSTHVDQHCAITRTGRHRRVQPDVNFRLQFCVFSQFTNLSHPPRPAPNTLVSSLRDRIFAFLQLLAELQSP